MAKSPNPFSMIAQLLRVPQPSAIDQAREREREKERQRKKTPEYRAKTRERVRKYREKK